MKTKKIKSHLLIENRILGSLVYFTDKEGRGCLKLSFKNKIADFVIGTNVPTSLPAPLALTTPITLDLSYKFQDHLLEVKKMIDKKPQPNFFNVPSPFKSWLFTIKLRDWHLLEIYKKKPRSPLHLTPPSANPSIIVIFSFLGAEGSPFKPHEYDCRMGTIKLPRTSDDTFCIGVAEDVNPSQTNDFIIGIPFPLKDF